MKIYPKWRSGSCIKLIGLPSKTKLKTIGAEAFRGDKALKFDIISWLIDSQIISIGNSGFAFCENLAGDFTGEIKNKNGVVINLGSSVFVGTRIQRAGKLSFIGKTKIEKNEFANITKFLGEDNSEVTALNIPEGITEIGDGAFSGCTSLKSVSLPSSLTNLRSWGI